MSNQKRDDIDDKRINTTGGPYFEGGVHTGGGDFVARDKKVVHGDEIHGDKVMGDKVGRDKIETLIQHLEEKIFQGDYVERQEFTQVFLVVPGAQEEVVQWLADQQGLDKRFLQSLDARAAPHHIGRQIEEVGAAQREAAAKGVPATPQTAYRLGMLAAYRRDYDVALDYLQQATQVDPDYSDAFEAIAWLQQTRAMDDIGRRDYDAAMRKVAAARSAVDQTDPLDPQALALRGYIAKTRAQLAEARQNMAERERYYTEAARFFEHVAQLDPTDPSAQNGLGNVLYALGDLDAAIAAYDRAVALLPTYTAAHHDLALAYEGKMKQEPVRATDWCWKALAAWHRVYQLAPEDPTFSADYLLTIGQRIRRLERQCG